MEDLRDRTKKEKEKIDEFYQFKSLTYDVLLDGEVFVLLDDFPPSLSSQSRCWIN